MCYMNFLNGTKLTMFNTYFACIRSLLTEQTAVYFLCNAIQHLMAKTKNKLCIQLHFACVCHLWLQHL